MFSIVSWIIFGPLCHVSLAWFLVNWLSQAHSLHYVNSHPILPLSFMIPCGSLIFIFLLNPSQIPYSWPLTGYIKVLKKNWYFPLPPKEPFSIISNHTRSRFPHESFIYIPKGIPYLYTRRNHHIIAEGIKLFSLQEPYSYSRRNHTLFPVGNILLFPKES